MVHIKPGWSLQLKLLTPAQAIYSSQGLPLTTVVSVYFSLSLLGYSRSAGFSEDMAFVY